MKENVWNVRNNKIHKVKFTDQSQIHEIPPKPKRTKVVEKRSRSAPSLDILKKPEKSESEKAKAETLEQSQRASVTSVEDLKKPSFDTTKNLNEKEKDDLNQVLTFLFWSQRH